MLFSLFYGHFSYRILIPRIEALLKYLRPVYKIFTNIWKMKKLMDVRKILLELNWDFSLGSLPADIIPLPLSDVIIFYKNISKSAFSGGTPALLLLIKCLYYAD